MCSKQAKLIALEWLCEEVTNHFLGGKIGHSGFTFLYAVGDEVVSNVEMPCSLTARLLFVLCKENGTLIVLTNIMRRVVPLAGHEKFGPRIQPMRSSMPTSSPSVELLVFLRFI